MKRFWKQATVSAQGTGWGVELDSRPLRTPARAYLEVPSRALADVIANEWAEAGEQVDPRAMPLTGLANAAIDRVTPDPAAFAGGLAKYAEGDLLCYRADGPAPLVEREARHWDPLLAWARRRFDVDFQVTAGIVHVPQLQATVDRLGHAVQALDPFRLAGLSPLVTIGGSLVAALAALEKAVGVDDAWAAVTVDEQWQLDQWGADAEAEKALENRRRDFVVGARFLELLSED